MQNSLTYCGKPLTRNGRHIYYGNVSDKYILALTVLESKKQNNLDISTKISVEIQDTSNGVGKGKTYRKTERNDLFSALTLGKSWLDAALDN